MSSFNVRDSACGCYCSLPIITLLPSYPAVFATLSGTVWCGPTAHSLSAHCNEALRLIGAQTTDPSVLQQIISSAMTSIAPPTPAAMLPQPVPEALVVASLYQLLSCLAAQSYQAPSGLQMDVAQSIVTHGQGATVLLERLASFHDRCHTNSNERDEDLLLLTALLLRCHVLQRPSTEVLLPPLYAACSVTCKQLSKTLQQELVAARKSQAQSTSMTKCTGKAVRQQLSSARALLTAALECTSVHPEGSVFPCLNELREVLQGLATALEPCVLGRKQAAAASQLQDSWLSVEAHLALSLFLEVQSLSVLALRLICGQVSDYFPRISQFCL